MLESAEVIGSMEGTCGGTEGAADGVEPASVLPPASGPGDDSYHGIC